jgi:peptide/nickel transport system permease protein
LGHRTGQRLNALEGADMGQYIVKRLLLMLPTLIGVALAVFLFMHVVPGDIALLILGGDQGGELNPQELVKLRTQLGLNRSSPLSVRSSPFLSGDSS